VRTLVAALIGFASGIASGAFGIGGALLSTPGIRWALDAPPLVAVGTTLPVIIPTAITGVIAYIRAGFVHARVAVTAAAAGGCFAILGALATELVAGEALLVATAGLLFVLSVRMLPKKNGSVQPPVAVAPTTPTLLAIGAVSGFVAGLLGVGGGVILVPVLSGLLRFPIKMALGTSLAVVAAQAIPGSVTHWLIGNIDWTIAGGLMLGVIPGARIGSRLAVAAEDRALRTVVAVAMMILAIVFGGTELREWLT
jgi:uncharacterized membrane protein YfcA